eukprot:NODE_303_length_11391_cov_0.177028.p7 type:complete len:108 gc:universal NODE_303_length_11391_cov_0.177028:6653-6330(-)
MAARNIYKYMYPYSISPQGSASVTNYCNGFTSIANFYVEILDYPGNQRFLRRNRVKRNIYDQKFYYGLIHVPITALDVILNIPGLACTPMYCLNGEPIISGISSYIK